MRVKSKLILALTVIVSMSIMPISLYFLDTLQNSILEKAHQSGKAQSEFFAKSLLNLLLTNAGNISATRVDARETIKVFESLQAQGLRSLEAVFLSADPQRHGLVLVSWPHKITEKVAVSDYFPEYKLSNCSLSPESSCMVFSATAGLENQAPSVAVRMEFAEHIILEPVLQLRKSLLGAVLLALVFVLLLGILMNLQILKPLRSLEIATRQLAAGNLDYRVEVKRRDEFGQLADSFNSMSQALKKHIAELDEKYRELNAARSIQLALLPETLPVNSQVHFAARFLPMAAVGGDIYDVFETPNGFVILVADVSGHGVPAALITGMAKMVISARPDLAEKPSEMLHHLNQSLIGQIGNRFLTLIYAFLNPQAKKLVFANGGHPDLVIVNRNSKSVHYYNVRGTMVGVFHDQLYEQRELKINIGDRIIFLTDGILECSNADDVMYADKRWEDFLKENADRDAVIFCDLLMQDIQSFKGKGMGLDDDATIVVADIL